MLVVTHYQRLLNYIVPDFVHVLVDGRIVRSGGKELALELEERGYSWTEARQSARHRLRGTKWRLKRLQELARKLYGVCAGRRQHRRGCASCAKTRLRDSATSGFRRRTMRTGDSRTCRRLRGRLSSRRAMQFCRRSTRQPWRMDRGGNAGVCQRALCAGAFGICCAAEGRDGGEPGASRSTQLRRRWRTFGALCGYRSAIRFCAEHRFLSDGAYVHVAAACGRGAPDSSAVLSTSGRAPTMTHPRNLIVAEDEGQAR